MLYGINYRDFHTAIHGNLIFDDEKCAHVALSSLKDYENLLEQDRVCTYEYMAGIIYIFETNTYGQIDEIDPRDIETLMVGIHEGQDVKIINQIEVDIY